MESKIQAQLATIRAASAIAAELQDSRLGVYRYLADAKRSMEYMEKLLHRIAEFACGNEVGNGSS